MNDFTIISLNTEQGQYKIVQDDNCNMKVLHNGVMWHDCPFELDDCRCDCYDAVLMLLEYCNSQGLNAKYVRLGWIKEDMSKRQFLSLVNYWMSQGYATYNNYYMNLIKRLSNQMEA